MVVVILLLGNWGSPGQHLYLLQEIHDLQGDAANDTLRIPQSNCTCLAGPFQVLAQQVEKLKQEWSIINNNISE